MEDNMVKTIMLSSIAIMSFAFLMTGPNINGKWNGIFHGPDGDFNVVFTFIVSGDSLTGNVQGANEEPMQISNGKINGNNFTFDVSFNDMTLNHKCTVMGDSILMKVPGMDGNEQEIVLKRANDTK
jgi:hypothetical protein